jgi:hypothetical protein
MTASAAVATSTVTMAPAAVTMTSSAIVPSVRMAKMVCAKAFSVKSMPAVVGTSVGIKCVIITCASGEQERHRRSAGDQ